MDTDKETVEGVFVISDDEDEDGEEMEDEDGEEMNDEDDDVIFNCTCQICKGEKYDPQENNTVATPEDNIIEIVDSDEEESTETDKEALDKLDQLVKRRIAKTASQIQRFIDKYSNVPEEEVSSFTVMTVKCKKKVRKAHRDAGLKMPDSSPMGKLSRVVVRTLRNSSKRLLKLYNKLNVHGVTNEEKRWVDILSKLVKLYRRAENSKLKNN